MSACLDCRLRECDEMIGGPCMCHCHDDEEDGDDA